MTSTPTSTSIDLACQEAVELVTDYLVDALAGDERAGLERHLRDCSPCAAYLEQVRTTVRLTGGLDGAAAKEAAVELVELFRRWRSPL